MHKITDNQKFEPWHGLSREDLEFRQGEAMLADDEWLESREAAHAEADLIEEDRMNARFDAWDEISEECQRYVGWPGDGSGEDDLADFNQNEADDYRGE